MRSIRVGTGVMLKRGNKILLGKRHLDKIEDGMPIAENMRVHTWTMPGGKLEIGETLYDCAKREVFEETGITALDMKIISINDASEATGFFVTVGFVCENFEGEVIEKEPEKISEWNWFDLDNLPSPLFEPSASIIKNYLQKEIYCRRRAREI